MNASPFDISETSDQLRESYTVCFRSRGGWCARWIPGGKFNDTWRKAAILCLKEGLDPDSHVRALLTTVRNPYPNMLVGERAVARTRSFVEREGCDEVVLFKAQLAKLRGCLNVGEPLEQSLTKQTGDFSATFRYCVASQAGLPAIAMRYKEEAMRELQFRPKLRELVAESFGEVLANGDDV